MSSLFSSKGKIASVGQVDFGIRQIALERLRTGAMNEASFRPRPPKSGGLRSMLATRSANTRFGSECEELTLSTTRRLDLQQLTWPVHETTSPLGREAT